METIPEQVVLEGRGLRVVVAPHLGAKIVSLRTADGREWLWQDPRVPLTPRRYGDRYEMQNAGGWDECFPTIAPCVYPEEPWQGIALPDHGELWTLPWEWRRGEEALETWVYGIRLPYRFERRLRLVGARSLVGEYQVENLAPYPLAVLWSAHPLFTAEAGTVIELPEGTPVLVDYSAGGRVPTGLEYHSWPYLSTSDGRRVDVSRFPGAQAGVAEKLFTGRLADGRVTLRQPDGAAVTLSWDAAEIPYLGLWINAGAWPSPDAPTAHIGLEPCTGYPDRLDRALQHGDYLRLGPREVRSWRCSLQFT